MRQKLIGFTTLALLLFSVTSAAADGLNELRQSCESGDDQACFELLLRVFLEDPGQNNPPPRNEPEIQGNLDAKSIGQLEAACRRGHGDACFEAALRYENGRARFSSDDPFYTKKMYVSYLYMTACDHGSPGGCNNYGVHLLRNGQESLAPMHFRKACNGGLDLGCQNLRDACSGYTFPPSGCPRW